MANHFWEVDLNDDVLAHYWGIYQLELKGLLVNVGTSTSWNYYHPDLYSLTLFLASMHLELKSSAKIRSSMLNSH